MLDVRVGYESNNSENKRITQAVGIDVKDAFEGGGNGNQNEGSSRTVEFQSLLLRTGERLTFKAGVDLSQLRDRSLTEDDFNGTFEFATLEDFANGTPTTYKVSTGDPLLEFTQVEAAAFVQNDLRVSDRLMLMFGVRYESAEQPGRLEQLRPTSRVRVRSQRLHRAPGGRGPLPQQAQSQQRRTAPATRRHAATGTRGDEPVLPEPLFCRAPPS